MNRIDWQQTLRQSVVPGTLAGLASAAVLAIAARRQTGSAVAAVNAESQWLWGEEALHEDRPTLKHTLPGFVTHQLSTVFWAAMYALARGTRQAPVTVPEALLGGAATSAAAAAIDYTLVPRRLRPGFEHRLSTGALLGVFAAMAAGLAVGTLVRQSTRFSR